MFVYHNTQNLCSTPLIANSGKPNNIWKMNLSVLFFQIGLDIFIQIKRKPVIYLLNLYSLMTPYDGKDIGQHLLR